MSALYQSQQQAPAASAAIDPPLVGAPEKSRWSWRRAPASRVEASRSVVPLGCLYTPLDEPSVELGYEPLRCGQCGAILNPHCGLDHRSKSWECPFCQSHTSFPPNYASITEHRLPAELMKDYTTVEYVKQAPPQRPAPVFVLVVDTCVDTAQEAEYLKGCLLKAVSRLPENASIALITFGAAIQLHDLSGATEFPRSLAFRGSSAMTAAALKPLLRRAESYACSLSTAEFPLTSIVEELSIDAWPVAKHYRAARCTGAALSVASSLLELVAPNCGSAVLCFLSGVCTQGPGQVVDLSREQMLRAHSDIRDRKAPLYDAGVAFYDELMRRMVAHGHALHVYMAALDQVGLAEMKSCIQATGGVVVSAETWKRPQIKASIDLLLIKRPDGALNIGMNAVMDVHTSPTWKVAGVIGQVIGTGKRSNCVADTEVGLGGTCQWTTAHVDPRSTYAIYFDTAAPGNGGPSSPSSPKGRPPPPRFVQFVTKYQQGLTDRIRVTTLRHDVADTTSATELAEDFDQEAAAVLVARFAVHKAESMPVFDVLRWLDRMAIRFVSRFGDYRKDQPQTLRLSQKLSHFPLFMFHLRRSAYLQLFNNSPDEIAALRLHLLRATAADSIVMIHPTLYSYSMGQAPVPVQLDTSSVTADTVLLLDTFFEIVVHHGETIRDWRKAGYESNPEYAHFAQFLTVPRADAQALAQNRFPAPRLIECGVGEPDSRILTNRINPSRTHNTGGSDAGQQQYGAQQGELVYTDDASLQTFMDHLKKLAVQSQ